ncbi:hypothetical protein [Trichococcus flocculiformis]|uniref:hypothetical protein n=1 Tax=Trichococcus flocculiformis TaxID=82803 RepID=UPI003DA56997
MKDTILVILAALLIVTNLENLLLDQEIEKQAERYETRLEVQEMKYRDELIEIRQELSGKQFDYDMSVNRIEQLNKEIGGTAYESK